MRYELRSAAFVRVGFFRKSALGKFLEEIHLVFRQTGGKRLCGIAVAVADEIGNAVDQNGGLAASRAR